MVRQEKELSQKRIADEHRRVAAEIGRALASRLNGLAREEASAFTGQPLRLARRDYMNPEVVLIAKIADARLVLPWEAASKAAAPMPPEADSEFSRTLRQAESAEFSSKDYSLAAERYRKAAAVARLPAEEGYARLQRARALAKMKKEQESSRSTRRSFLSPPRSSTSTASPCLFTPSSRSSRRDGCTPRPSSGSDVNSDASPGSLPPAYT
jgi:hypothetical protein